MKSATPKVQPKEVSAVRILKIATCPTLSTSSTLTYQIGCHANEIGFRLYASTGSGYFNRDWIPLKAILDVFDQHPADKPITSFTMCPLYEGKSINSPGFLLATLKAEGFVQETEDRGYQRTDPAAFMAEVKALMESGVNLDPDEKPKAIKKSKAKEVA